MKKNFKIKAKVWRWPGDGGWHFVTLEKELSKKIRDVYTKGFVRVVATVGKTSWDTSLFPHKLSQSYLLSVKKSVRQKENIFEGDSIKLAFKIV